MFGWYDFRVQERNFTIGQSPKIWGNFSKMCSKINKNVKKLLRKLETNRNCPENILIFGREMGKRRNMIWTGYIWRGSGERGRRGPQGKNSRNLFSSSLVQVDGAATQKTLEIQLNTQCTENLSWNLRILCIISQSLITPEHKLLLIYKKLKRDENKC